VLAPLTVIAYPENAPIETVPESSTGPNLLLAPEGIQAAPSTTPKRMDPRAIRLSCNAITSPSILKLPIHAC